MACIIDFSILTNKLTVNLAGHSTQAQSEEHLAMLFQST